MAKDKYLFIITVLYGLIGIAYGQEALPALSVSPSPVGSAVDDEDVPLDAWIIKKKVDSVPSIAVSPSAAISLNASPEASPDEISEEKRVYKALLEEQKKEQEEKSNQKNNSRNPRKGSLIVFKKTALSKYDQSRIDKVKSVQKSVIQEQKIKFAELLQAKKDKLSTFRFCALNYPVIGLPSELKKIDPKIKSAEITSDWKDGLKLIVQNECNVVLYTGMFGKTNAKGIEFLDKTMEFIKKATGVNWKQVPNPNQSNVFFAVLFDPNVIELGKVESLSGLVLRRGGPFKEDNFSIIPLELTLEKKNESKAKKYTILAFDLRDSANPLRKLKVHYVMQMASSLLEASINRVKQSEDSSVVLTGNLGENRKHPGFQILQGVFTPVDFLDGKACKLAEDQAELFSCDKSKLAVVPRTMLGLFSDLSHLLNKTSRIGVNRGIDKLTSEVFLAENALNNAKNENNKLIGASLDVIKGKQFEYTFLYMDLLGGDKE